MSCLHRFRRGGDCQFSGSFAGGGAGSIRPLAGGRVYHHTARCERIHQVRRASRFLVTIGACATAGGIQALRNFKDVKEFTSIVYATPAYIETLNRSTPIADHVPVDFGAGAVPSTRRSWSRSSARTCIAASPTRRPTAFALSASAGARSASWSRTARRVSAPSPTHRLQGDLSCVSSRLLRVLWAHGDPEYHFSKHLVEPSRSPRRGPVASVSRVQRLC